MKMYVITLSRVFMKSHRRAGEPTNFADKFRKTKIHTIRTNYDLWRKRFDEIEKGEACLSVRQWADKPYRSKQIEIARLTKDDNIGLQKLYIRKTMFGKICPIINNKIVDIEKLANNDGLPLEDWIVWFDKDDMLSYEDLPRPLPIIHFTSFRYHNE